MEPPSLYSMTLDCFYKQLPIDIIDDLKRKSINEHYTRDAKERWYCTDIVASKLKEETGHTMDYWLWKCDPNLVLLHKEGSDTWNYITERFRPWEWERENNVSEVVYIPHPNSTTFNDYAIYIVKEHVFIRGWNNNNNLSWFEISEKLYEYTKNSQIESYFNFIKVREDDLAIRNKDGDELIGITSYVKYIYSKYSINPLLIDSSSNQ